MFIGRIDAEVESPIVWPPDAQSGSEKTLMLENIEAGGERGDRGWDGWMALPTQQTWVWANSER